MVAVLRRRNGCACAERRFVPTARAGPPFVERSALPGFGLTIGLTILILSIIVLIPVAAVVIRAAGLTPAAFAAAAFSPRAISTPMC